MTTSSATTGSGVLPSSCDAKAGDDTCTACEKKSCCAELQTCSADKACAATYGVYTECLFPGGEASGYTSTYCQAVAGEQSPVGKKSADAIISCLTTTCGTEAACGVPEKVTWDNFANEFVEDHCNGCHFPGFSDWNSGKFVGSSDPLTNIPQFTDDVDWATWSDPNGGSTVGAPEFGPSWQTESNFTLVSEPVLARKIWCGVSVTLPDFCKNEFPSHFPKAQRFPPPGVEKNGTVAGPSCEWTADGSCPHPTDVERNKMVSWVFDGAKKN
jgi:hypothetical protein